MPTQAMFSVLYPRDKKFVGRESIFDEMEHRLGTEHCVSLLGMGGVGKSQIAIEYAYRTRNRYPHRHVFWVYAANSTRFDQAYQEIARHLKLDGYDDPKVDTAHLVYEWLSAENHAEWLMIIDNADDTNIFMHQSSQDSTTGQVESATMNFLANRVPRRLNSKKLLIVTTRNRPIGEDLSNGEPCLEVGPFSVKEAQDLLRSKARGVMDQSDTLESEELVEILGRIPLAITQAAAFMVRNRFKVEQYLAALEKDERTRMDFLSTELQDSRRERGTPNSVFRTWSLSFEQLRTKAPRAAQLLSLMAMLDPERIPDDLLLEQDEKGVDFATGVGTLIDYSLITKEVGEETCAMHPLVQLSVQYWLERERQTAYFAGRALQVLAKKFPDREHENRRVCEVLLPHARASLKHAIEEKDDQQHRAKLLYHVGWFDWRQGRYDLAYENASAAYNVDLETFGDEDKDTLATVGLLGTILFTQGKYKAAEAMHRRALAGQEKISGAEHPDTLTSVSNLALVLLYQGEYKAAEAMCRRALAGREKVLGVEHPDTLTSVNNLATVLQNQGEYKAAEAMYRRVLAGQEKVLGAEHPDTLTSVNNLATVLQNQGECKAAEAMYRQALAGREKVLGVEHPDTLKSVGNLALLLQDQSDYKAAEAIYRRALAGQEKVLGVEHPDTLTTVYRLAYLFHAQYRFAQADELYRMALRGYGRALDAGHPATAACQRDYSSLLREWNGGSS